MERMVYRASKVLRVLKVFKELKDFKELKVIREHKVNVVLPEQMEKMEQVSILRAPLILLQNCRQMEIQMEMAI